MEVRVVALLALCITVFCASIETVAGDESLSMNDARNDLTDTACEVKDNYTLLADYHEGVRERHGIVPGDSYGEWFAAPLYRLPEYVRCRKLCPDVTDEDVTWCVNIWNYDAEVELCVNSSGLVNASSMAKIANIFEHFEMPENCAPRKDYRTGCLLIKNPKYYLNRAYLTCISQTDNCTTKSFYDVEVSVTGYDSERPTLVNPWAENEVHELVLGETAILQCSVMLKGLYPFAGWNQDGHQFEPIAIDATCNPTIEDCTHSIHSHPDFGALLAQHKHQLQSTENIETCPTTEIQLNNYLRIVNVTESDAGVYTCNATSLAYIPAEHWDRLAWTLTAITVPPERELNLIEFPESSLYTIPSRSSFNWTVVLTSSSYDNVSWVFNDSPVVIVDDLPVVIVDNSSVCLEPQSNRSVEGNVFATMTEQYILNYTSQFTATLYICNATTNNTGLYSLEVKSRKRNHQPVKFKVDVIPEVTEEPAVHHKQGQDEVITIVIPIVTALLVAGIVILITALYCIRRKSNMKADLTDIFTQEEHYIPREYMKKGSTAELLPADPMEFPRSKLHIFHDRVLGEGTFGKVLQARAEGIVEGAPSRNIVAVKSTKDAATPKEIDDLWDEMLLMKGMEPHENILNLLGHCTTSAGPLRLIIEYAIYGSLKDFLRQCEETILSLNHMPLIARSISKTRSASSSSCSSSYPLIVDKLPLSAQTSVFSANTPNGQNNFVFPPSHRHRLLTQDSGFYTDHEEASQTAHSAGVSTPLAHTVTPITHDYVNSKGLVYMEDVQNFALQIACGLQHLENMQLVHCDLAARNILIAEGFVLKIADFGMARNVGEKAYYRKSPRGRIPVKWTAPEALENHLFTYKSDVWSFGVVLWEIFTYAHVPYHEINIRSWEPFITYLKEGNRLPKPDGCTDYFYDIMQQCWHLNPDQRPTASELVVTLNPEAEKWSSSGCGSDHPGTEISHDGTEVPHDLVFQPIETQV